MQRRASASTDVPAPTPSSRTNVANRSTRSLMSAPSPDPRAVRMRMRPRRRTCAGDRTGQDAAVLSVRHGIKDSFHNRHRGNQASPCCFTAEINKHTGSISARQTTDGKPAAKASWRIAPQQTAESWRPDQGSGPQRHLPTGLSLPWPLLPGLAIHSRPSRRFDHDHFTWIVSRGQTEIQRAISSWVL